MSGKKGIMSEALKQEIAMELGVQNVVTREGWGDVSSRDCGNMVTTAIQIANRKTSQTK